MKTNKPYYLETWLYPMKIQLKCSCHGVPIKVYSETALYSLKETIPIPPEKIP